MDALDFFNMGIRRFMETFDPSDAGNYSYSVMVELEAGIEEVVGVVM